MAQLIIRKWTTIGPTMEHELVIIYKDDHNSANYFQINGLDSDKAHLRSIRYAAISDRAKPKLQYGFEPCKQ